MDQARVIPSIGRHSKRGCRRYPPARPRLNGGRGVQDLRRL